MPQDAVLSVRRSGLGGWFNMEKITANADDIVDYGIVLHNIVSGTFRNLMAANAARGGMVIEGCQSAHFNHIHSHFNSGFGILMIRCNGAHFYHVTTTVNSGDGLIITGDPTQHVTPLIGPTDKTLRGSGGLWIYGFNSEGNGSDNGAPDSQNFKDPSPQRGHGLVLYKLRGGAHINGGWIEGNRGDGIYIEDGQNSNITNLKMLVGVADDHRNKDGTPNESLNYYTYKPRWLRVQGNESWGNIIEHNHAESTNGIMEIGFQAFAIDVEEKDKTKNTVWSLRKESLFHDQKHLMVKIKNESDPSKRPTFERATKLPRLSFQNAAGQTIASARFLNVFQECLQFVKLTQNIPSANGKTYVQLWDRSQSDIDPLNEAVKVTSGDWSADLEFVDNRILVANHQLNRNYYKHNARHTVSAPQIIELQHYIIFGDAIEGNVLLEETIA